MGGARQRTFVALLRRQTIMCLSNRVVPSCRFARQALHDGHVEAIDSPEKVESLRHYKHVARSFQIFQQRIVHEEDRFPVLRTLVTFSAVKRARSARDVLLQSIDLAIAAEELGADGAYYRVHHFARQLASPFPLLAAIGAKTNRVEIGTGVIDMRYENPLYMAEDAARPISSAAGDSSSASAAARPSR